MPLRRQISRVTAFDLVGFLPKWLSRPRDTVGTAERLLVRL